MTEEEQAMPQMPKEKSKTTQIVEGILSNSIKHKFSVSVDGVHATKRECVMFGPILHITDPHRLLPNLFLFMPMWDITLKKAKNHRSLILHSEKVEEINEIKIKSKNLKVFNHWYKQIGDAKESMLNNVKIRFANHKLRLNKDGTFVVAKYQMNNDSVKIIVNEKVVIDIPRYPESWAAPNAHDFEKVHLYRGDHMVATIKCNNPLQAVKLIIEMNVLPEDLLTQPTIEVEHITVPELDDEMFDNTSASSFSSTSNLMLDKVLELGEEEEEEEEANEKAKKSSRGKNKAKKSAGEEEKPIELKEKKKKKKRVNPQEKYSFANQMAEKMEKLNELPRNEKRPVPDDIIKTVVATFKLNVKPGTAPKITIPDDYKDDDETGISEFEIPNEPYTQSLFNTNIKIEHNEIRTINSNYNIKDTFKSLPENVQEQLKKVGVKPVDKKMNDFERIFENIEKLSGDELPAFATGVFLNGRMHSCADLAKSLLNIRFSCHKIREIFSDLHVTDKKGYLAFFYQLYSENLTSMFFKAILNMPSFRIANYFPDALMREDKTCIILANNARKATKQIKSPTIPFKLETAPRLLLFGSIPIFQQNQTEQWISANNERQLATPFSMIIASLIELIAKTYSDKDCKSILYHGEYGIIWNKLFQLREMFTDSFEEHFYTKRKAHRNEKVTEVLIYALVENRIIDLLAHFIDEENPSSNVISEFVLCISELLKLKQSFVPDCMNDPNIFHQVTADLDKIFTRDPPRKKKAPVKQKSALEKIVDEAKETTVNIVNEAASKANEVVAKAGDAVAVLNDQVQKTVA